MENESQVLLRSIKIENTDDEMIKAFFSILGERLNNIQSTTWEYGDDLVLSILIKTESSRLYFDFYFRNRKLMSIFFQEYLKEQ